eukprot:1971821-Rhodomonas_salina.1
MRGVIPRRAAVPEHTPLANKVLHIVAVERQLHGCFVPGDSELQRRLTHKLHQHNHVAHTPRRKAD